MKPRPSKVRHAIDDLHYDFQQFEIVHFLSHVAVLRDRPIICKGTVFEEKKLFGLWLRREDSDFIFYNIKAYALHRVHIILHEVGHMVLGHKPKSVSEILGDQDDLWSRLKVSEDKTFVYLPRHISQLHHPTDEQEVEAEAFSDEAQHRIIRANRFDYLVDTSSSIPGFSTFADTLGFTE